MVRTRDKEKLCDVFSHRLESSHANGLQVVCKLHDFEVIKSLKIEEEKKY